eukprot:TRINITY_DN4469_c0_g1_i4.p1 TRINITY_DN4469_c0_g1~~TRINITY_DN4469_c0_g1_i4.p1  ORF type:complete len:1801 (+),score=126.74 TRINITY_DN4469_c0_g1_i4:107-5509(+)
MSKTLEYEQYGARIERDSDIGRKFGAVLRAAKAGWVSMGSSMAVAARPHAAAGAGIAPAAQDTYDAHEQLFALQQRLARLTSHVDTTLSRHVQQAAATPERQHEVTGEWKVNAEVSTSPILFTTRVDTGASPIGVEYTSPRLVSAWEQIAALREQMQQRQAENEETRAALAAAEAAKDGLEAARRRQEEEMTVVADAGEEQKAAAEALRQELAAAQHRAGEAELRAQELAAVRREHDTLQTQYEALVAELERARAATAEDTARLAALAEENAAIRTENEAAKVAAEREAQSRRLPSRSRSLPLESPSPGPLPSLGSPARSLAPAPSTVASNPVWDVCGGSAVAEEPATQAPLLPPQLRRSPSRPVRASSVHSGPADVEAAHRCHVEVMRSASPQAALHPAASPRVEASALVVASPATGARHARRQLQTPTAVTPPVARALHMPDNRGYSVDHLLYPTFGSDDGADADSDETDINEVTPATRPSAPRAAPAGQRVPLQARPVGRVAAEAMYDGVVQGTPPPKHPYTSFDLVSVKPSASPGRMDGERSGRGFVHKSVAVDADAPKAAAKQHEQRRRSMDPARAAKETTERRLEQKRRAAAERRHLMRTGVAHEHPPVAAAPGPRQPEAAQVAARVSFTPQKRSFTSPPAAPPQPRLVKHEVLLSDSEGESTDIEDVWWNMSTDGGAKDPQANPLAQSEVSTSVPSPARSRDPTEAPLTIDLTLQCGEPGRAGTPERTPATPVWSAPDEGAIHLSLADEENQAPPSSAQTQLMSDSDMRSASNVETASGGAPSLRERERALAAREKEFEAQRAREDAERERRWQEEEAARRRRREAEETKRRREQEAAQKRKAELEDAAWKKRREEETAAMLKKMEEEAAAKLEALEAKRSAEERKAEKERKAAYEARAAEERKAEEERKAAYEARAAEERTRLDQIEARETAAAAQREEDRAAAAKEREELAAMAAEVRAQQERLREEAVASQQRQRAASPPALSAHTSQASVSAATESTNLDTASDDRTAESSIQRLKAAVDDVLVKQPVPATKGPALSTRGLMKKVLASPRQGPSGEATPTGGRGRGRGSGSPAPRASTPKNVLGGVLKDLRTAAAGAGAAASPAVAGRGRGSPAARREDATGNGTPLNQSRGSVRAGGVSPMRPLPASTAGRGSPAQPPSNAGRGSPVAKPPDRMDNKASTPAGMLSASTAGRGMPSSSAGRGSPVAKPPDRMDNTSSTPAGPLPSTGVGRGTPRRSHAEPKASPNAKGLLAMSLAPVSAGTGSPRHASPGVRRSANPLERTKVSLAASVLSSSAGAPGGSPARLPQASKGAGRGRGHTSPGTKKAAQPPSGGREPVEVPKGAGRGSPARSPREPQASPGAKRLLAASIASTSPVRPLHTGAGRGVPSRSPARPLPQTSPGSRENPLAAAQLSARNTVPSATPSAQQEALLRHASSPGTHPRPNPLDITKTSPAASLMSASIGTPLRLPSAEHTQPPVAGAPSRSPRQPLPRTSGGANPRDRTKLSLAGSPARTQVSEKARAGAARVLQAHGATAQRQAPLRSAPSVPGASPSPTARAHGAKGPTVPPGKGLGSRGSGKEGVGARELLSQSAGRGAGSQRSAGTPGRGRGEGRPSAGHSSTGVAPTGAPAPSAQPLPPPQLPTGAGANLAVPSPPRVMKSAVKAPAVKPTGVAPKAKENPLSSVAGMAGKAAAPPGMSTSKAGNAHGAAARRSTSPEQEQVSTDARRPAGRGTELSGAATPRSNPAGLRQATSSGVAATASPGRGRGRLGTPPSAARGPGRGAASVPTR